MSQTPATTPVAIVEAELALVKYNADGLVPVVTQDANTKQVLMMAWMNAETLRMTLAEGRMVYYSRSRQEVLAQGRHQWRSPICSRRFLRLRC